MSSAIDSAQVPIILSETAEVYRDAGLMAQTLVMFEFASGNGLDLPVNLIKNYAMLCAKKESGLTGQELEELASIHQQLRRIIAPATPRTCY